MSKTKKILLSILVVGVLAAVGVYYYVYKVNHGIDVNDTKGIEITADQLVQEFNTNEDSANKKYVNQVLQVTGDVKLVGKDSMSSLVILKSSDDLTGVFFRLKAGQPEPDSGKTVTIKGILDAKLTDVTFRDGIIIKK
jgi:hypothetical protein